MIVPKKSSAIKSSISLLLTRMIGLSLGFFTTILFARNTSPDDYGFYVLVTSWIGLLYIPSCLGMPEYLLRHFAEIPAQNFRHTLNIAIKKTTIIFSIICLIIFILFSTNVIPTKYLAPALIQLPTIILSIIMHMKQSAMRHFCSADKALWPTTLLAPLLTASLALIYIQVEERLEVNALLQIGLISTILTFLINEWLFEKTLKKHRQQKNLTTSIAHKNIDLIKKSLPFAGLAALATLNSRVDIFALGFFRSEEEVGIFTVATKMYDLLLIPITIMNTTIAAEAAKLYKEEKTAELQQLIKKTSRFTFITISCAVVILVSFNKEIITATFGEQYLTASAPMCILVSLHIINSYGGSSGMLLSMCGKEFISIRIGLFCAALNIILNLILTPKFGITGATISTAISFTLWRIGFMLAVKKHLNLNP